MELITTTSPHHHTPLSTDAIMRKVLWATIPGFLVLFYYFSWGILINLLLVSFFALVCESVALLLRGRSPLSGLKDYSALVTAVLLGLSLPPLIPWWMCFIGASFAILVAKHLYGGLGYNPFNPAMVGYVVLLICFPLEMSTWLTPSVLLQGSALSLADSLNSVLAGGVLNDAYTMATPLDSFKFRDGLTVSEYWQAPEHGGVFAGVAVEWVNIAFLIGGLWLLQQRIYTYHAPLGMLLGLLIMSILFYQGGSSESGGSPLFHWLSGATMLGAFFIITDPVTSTSGRNARFYYGLGIGILVYIIRVFGGYPDAVAFAVLLMNFAAPFMDQYIKPHTYGQGL